MRRAYGGSSRPSTSWQRTANTIARAPFPPTHHPRQQQETTYANPPAETERAYYSEGFVAQQQQGQYPTFPPRQHRHHQAYRSASMPLQTIANHHSKTSAQPTKEHPLGVQKKETPMQQKPSAKKPSKMGFPLLKSPITMCFERMLGAGESFLDIVLLVLP